MLVPSVEAILSGDRRALARAITITESTRPDHQVIAASLLDDLLPHSGGAKRIGISGTPGVGKSTFIESLGLHLIDQGHKVAVLAVDPSSKRTGGSILGDRTRMVELSSRPEVYIRSSPSGGELGGVAAQTSSAIAMCEAAGFTTVLIETVGVGQSETAVGDLSDLFLLLVAPMGGDDLQGIKRGVMEMADIITINKADGPLSTAAERTAGDYRSALSLVRPKWPGRPTQVLLCSALERRGITDVWRAIEVQWNGMRRDGAIESLRSEQAVRSFWKAVNAQILATIRHGSGEQELAELEQEVRTGSISPCGAASRVAAHLSP